MCNSEPKVRKQHKVLTNDGPLPSKKHPAPHGASTADAMALLVRFGIVGGGIDNSPTSIRLSALVMIEETLQTYNVPCSS